MVEWQGRPGEAGPRCTTTFRLCHKTE